MRPVVLQMGVSLGGFVHGAKGDREWGLPPEEDDVVEWKAASLREAGTLIREDLIDEYRLVIHRVAVGNGTGLFGPLREPRRVDLVEARTFPSETMTVVYRPHEETR